MTGNVVFRLFTNVSIITMFDFDFSGFGIIVIYEFSLIQPKRYVLEFFE